MTARDFSHFLSIAQQCADAARSTIIPYFRAGLEVISKSDSSPVTLADQQTETAIRDLLERECPRHSILGEEAGQSGALNAEWLWVIDPIDGTRAFVTGRPNFCTLIALLHHGRPLLSIIDQPITKERWIGLQGKKTRYEAPLFPGKIGTRLLTSLSEAELSCTAPDIIRPEYQERFKSLQKATKRTSWGGDAYGYGLLSLGQIDLIAEDTLKPWDWAALVPIIEGAGGCMTDWQGKPLSLESNGSVLACGNPALLTKALKALA